MQFAGETRRGNALPKRLVLWLAVMSATGGSLLGSALWCYAHPALQFRFPFPPDQLYRVGPLFHALLTALLFIAALSGLVGLVNAQRMDRRWRAVFLLALTIVALCAQILAALHQMDLPVLSGTVLGIRCGGIALVGLGLTGLSLR
jgi:hypothetical protein